MDNKLIISALLFSTLTLSACGGSGGNSGATSFNAQSRVSITATNSDEIAAEASGASSTSVASGLVFRGGQQVQPFLKAQLLSLVTKVNRSLSLRSKSSTPQNKTESCLTSGSVTTNQGSNSSIQISFDNCVEYGVSISGSISGSTSNAITTITFDNLVISSSSPVFNMSLNGTMLSREVGNAIVIDGSNAYIAMTYSGRKLEIGHFNIEEEEFFTSSRSKFDMEINSSTLGGSYKIETTQDLYTNDGEEFPYEGQILIYTGDPQAVNPSIRVTAQSSTAILVEVDVDGDGVYEKTSSIITWAALEAEL